MSFIYVSIDQKTKIKDLYEGNFFCSNCRKNTNHKLFSVKKDLKIYGVAPIGRLENAKILQCQNCGLEKQVFISETWLQDKAKLKKELDNILKTKNYYLYNKNLRECDKCGVVIGDIFELSKTNDTLLCQNCGHDVSSLIKEAENKKSAHSKKVLIVLIVIGVIIILQYILEKFGISFE